MSEILIPIFKKNLWGFANLNGEIAIEPQFIEVTPFKNGTATVCVKEIPAREFFSNETIKTYSGKYDKIWGIIDINGNHLIDPNFKSIKIVNNGIAIGIKYAGKELVYNDYCKNIYHLVNFKSEKYPRNADDRYNSFSVFSNNFWFLTYGRDPVGKDYCWSRSLIVNNNGEKILELYGECKVSDFENGIIKIFEKKLTSSYEEIRSTSFYNEKGELLYTKNIEFENISKNVNGFYFIKENDKYFRFDLKGNNLIEVNFQIDLSYKFFKPEIFIKTYPKY
ncbi:MAG: WG repeat-containing protein [Flavobacteriaceae bacterium]|nr:WG repeat-containing protein [Flavobacteriaceae bacterium]